MWIVTSDAFLSVVHKDCQPDELLVRARREGDIQAVFPKAKVSKTVGSDYLFRAVIKRSEVISAMSRQLMDLAYPNFKNSIRDDQLHAACNKVWHTMAALQPIPPYSRGGKGQF